MSTIFENLQKSLQNLGKINLAENFSEIVKSPISILALLGLLVLIIVLLRSKKIEFTPKLMTRIGLMIALSVALDILKIYRFPQGGSITFGSMVPLLIVSFWYGPAVGLLAGMLFGSISLILGPFIVHPIQVLFDYPLPFLLLGTAGYFKNKYLGTLTAVGLRFICHIISGVVFFAEYAGDQSPIVYSIIYNGSYLLPELIISLIILALLPVDRIRKAIA